MEGQHGIDVSWLHHSHSHANQKGHADQSLPQKANAVKTSQAKAGAEPAPSPRTSTGARSSSASQPDSDAANGGSHPSSLPFHRPHLHSRTSTDRLASSPGRESSASKSPPSSSPLRVSGKKSSWISGFTSKFSTSPSAAQENVAPPATSVKGFADKEMPMAVPSQIPARRASLSEATPPPPDESIPYTPAAPKTSQPSFLQSALRRLSSSSSGQLSGMGRAVGTGGICERRVMNIDPHRERCRVRDLDASKLRRVAFCVDVEIAGGPRYNDEEPLGDRSQQVHSKKLKEKGEGEALKHPEQVKESKEKDGVVTVDGETVEAEPAAGTGQAQSDPHKDPTKKKEKKRRSEGERKERKERKRKQAEANGSIPIEMREGDDDETPPSTTPPGAATPKSQDRPTTDPLRIYRRCCQLRETSILRKVTDQLSSPTCSAPGMAGMVTVLDLSGHWMHLADIVTLGDWLAVVPVKKLIMENCGLSDEGLRVILAGLLASKTRTSRKTRSASNRSTATGASAGGEAKPASRPERGGSIEKLSLKNNPQIGRDGWRFICLFIHLSRSIKAIDVSSIPFPQPIPASNGGAQQPKTPRPLAAEMSCILAEATAERLAGSHFEELVMSDCQLSADNVKKILAGTSKCGVKRLGFAKNHLNEEGLQHIADHLRQGQCEGLDLGGNDLQDLLHLIAAALDGKNPLYALSLADCNLLPSSLSTLFPALVALPNFRFIDLSHNRSLFVGEQNALGLLRKYIPRLRILKRIHLADVALTSEQAIALAEVLPESPSLAHLSILENAALSEVARAKDEANQEEACALYASLMAAVRVSNTIICIDVDVPAPESSDIVKALAKQVVAYCLRNMERGPMAEYDSAAATIADPHGGERQVVVPDVLLHLVGHMEGESGEHDGDEPAPDDDYVIGGSGVVKALGICLGSKKAYDGRRPSRDVSSPGSGAATPKTTPMLGSDDLRKGRAKDMSKNLLGSARKIRARLRPALIREAKEGNDTSHRRLLFLDQTLERMILRFEDEYPECRLPSPPPAAESALLDDDDDDEPSAPLPDLSSSPSEPTLTSPILKPQPSTHPGTASSATPPPLSRHGSDVSLASRTQLFEEGRMHRFGQQVRREVLRPQTLDHAHGTTGDEKEERHLTLLREKLEGMQGGEIERFVGEKGVDGGVRELREMAHAGEATGAADQPAGGAGTPSEAGADTVTLD